ncbi:MAG: hypothetical protein D6701_12805 [Gemmatimonadetes bacterium]|nr:MAG: hypothetical protein D6701_12805 [Gemmatimonadota bacterium]
MFREILRVQWKATRWPLLPFIAAAFGLPLLAVSRMPKLTGRADPLAPMAEVVLTQMQVLLPLFPLLAFLVGVATALSAWAWDHQVEHVYPLSLPVKRDRYVALKAAAGALFLLAPTAAFWAGSHIAVAVVELPSGLRAYPDWLTFRFLLASLFGFALLFAFAAGTMRTAVATLAGLVLLLVFGSLATDYLSANLTGFNFHLTPWLWDALSSWPGPFHVLTGNWMLIDV